MAMEGVTEYSINAKKLIEDYGDQAIQCCVNEWNQLCSEHPLTNVTKIAHQKRWRFFGHDVAVLEEDGACGEICKIELEINQHLTAKAIRKHPDSPVIVLNCRTWWNCEEEKVHGWSYHIEIDVMKCCITQFPEIIPVTPHVYSYPLN